MHDKAVRVVTGGLGQQGGRKTTSAAGLQWPAWSSAGPAKHTHLYTVYIYLNNSISSFISHNTHADDEFMVLLYEHYLTLTKSWDLQVTKS